MGSCYKVELHAYDMAHGMAKYLGPLLVSKPVEAVWHTSVVVYDNEYSYGTHGIETLEEPGAPKVVTEIGLSCVPKSATDAFVAQLSLHQFTGDNYDLFENNCHVFSNTLCQFLCEQSIPDCYLYMPEGLLGPNKKAGLKRALVRGGISASTSAGGVSGSCSSAPQVMFPLLFASCSSGYCSSKSKPKTT